MGGGVHNPKPLSSLGTPLIRVTDRTFFRTTIRLKNRIKRSPRGTNTRMLVHPTNTPPGGAGTSVGNGGCRSHR